MQPTDSRDESGNADEQRSYLERRILIGVLLIPVFLGMVVNGWLSWSVRYGCDWLMNHLVWPLALVMPMLTTWTLLLTWRSPILARPWWRPLAIVCLTLTLPSIANVVAILWNVPTSNPGRTIALAARDLPGWTVILSGVVVLGFLIRRLTGLCLTRLAAPLPYRPFTIAELIGWIAVAAVGFAVVPRMIAADLGFRLPDSAILSDYEHRSLLSAYALRLGLQSFVTVASTLLVLGISRLRWSFRIPLAIASLWLLDLIETGGQALAYSVPFDFGVVGSLRAACFTAAAILLAIAILQRRGYRIRRQRRRRTRQP
jgi:hypothetical protein